MRAWCKCNVAPVSIFWGELCCCEVKYSLCCVTFTLHFLQPGKSIEISRGYNCQWHVETTTALYTGLRGISYSFGSQAGLCLLFGFLFFFFFQLSNKQSYQVGDLIYWCKQQQMHGVFCLAFFMLPLFKSFVSFGMYNTAVLPSTSICFQQGFCCVGWIFLSFIWGLFYFMTAAGRQSTPVLRCIALQPIIK